MNNFIKHAFVLLCILFATGINAQTIERSVINTTGGLLAPMGGPQLHQNVGETFSTPLSGGGYMLTQGFIQPLVASVAPITGTISVCAGSTTTLSSATAGGTWSSSNTTVATVGSTGIVAGLVAGTTTISYTVSGSSVTAVVTVNALPTVSAITGNTTLSTAITTTLSNTTGGGSWSSSTSGVTTVNSSGVVTGVGAGTSIISYTVSVGGCSTTVTTVVTVNTPNTALNLDGTNDYVNIGSVLTANQSYTKEAWVYANASSSSNIISGGSHPFWLAGGRLSTQQGTLINDPALFPLGEWVHVAATYDAASTTLKLYKNGNLIASTTSAGSYPEQTIYIGEYPFSLGNAFNGNIDEVRIWNVARTESDIKANMNCNIAQNANLIAYYRFDNGIANGTNTGLTKAIDYSGNNNCGILNNFTLTGTFSNFVPGAVGNCNTIYDTVASISGLSSVCVESTITLSSTTTGGTWMSSNIGVASVNSSGIVTGITAGTTTISYTYMCTTVTKVVSVNTIPDAGMLTGGVSVCVGGELTIYSSVEGGSWSSSSDDATISSSGDVTGVSTGIATISYTVSNECGTATSTINITVNTTPDAGTVTGASTVCIGNTITLSNATAGGSWSSLNSEVATVGSTGVVLGMAAGTTTISYTLGNECGTTSAVKTITVNPLPNAGSITGASTVCAGSATIFTNATVSGGMWSSSNSGIATVGSTGVVSAIASGTATISYTVSNECGTSITTKIITVNPLPSAGIISGSSSVNVGSSISLSNTVSGGVWSSSNTAVATVGSTGEVTGLSAGTTIISYSVSNSCGTAVATKVVTVNFVFESEITGTLIVCVGSTTTLSNATSGGSWSSSNPAIATINAEGVATGMIAGTTTISYTISGVSTTAVLTVNPLPNAGTISGAANVCAGSTITLTNPSVSGGTWSSSSDAASVSSTGVVTGVAAGSATISYSVSNSCGTAVATKEITILSLPDAGTLSGTASICVGATTTFSSTVSGGTWSSGYPAGATVSSTGVVTGIVNGSFVISYRMVNGCGTAVVTRTVTVSPVPNAGTIGGANVVCVGATTTMPFITAVGSVWSSSDPSVATINASRVVTGVAAGTVTISHTSTTGCGSATATKVMTVNPLPVAGTLSGAAVVCVGNTTTITPSASGGTWFSSNVARATVSAAGLVTGVSAGAVVINYRVTNSCGIATATHAVSVNPAAAVAAIGGTSSVCAGSTITLTNATAGGTWSSTNTSAATISSTGVVTGVAGGNTIISYVVTNSCGTIATTKSITVNPLPVAGTISGASAMCTGTTTTLSTTGTGGSWISGNPPLATVNSSTGLVTAIAAGTVPMTYRVTNGCGTANAVHVVTISAMPVVGATSGASLVCAGSSTTYTNPTGPGVGVWSSSETTVATINASTGVLTGVAGGTTTISYVKTNGCGSATATRVVTVLPLPVIGVTSGTSTICTGSTTTLSNTVPGGTWSSSYTAGATVTSAGVVTGVSNGTFIISYRLANACGTSYELFPITVMSAPALSAITGTATVCEAATTTLGHPIAGGVWTSSNTGVATIAAPAVGTVTGVAAGTSAISYTATNMCGTSAVGRVVTVTVCVPRPAMTGSTDDKNSLFSVVPNPTTGTVTLTTDVTGKVSIYTIDGKQLQQYEAKAGNTSITLPAGIASGVYMLRFEGNDGSSNMVRLVYQQ